MKWINKGHEFDEVSAVFSNLTKIAIFGAGDYGKQLYELMRSDLEIAGFLDNNSSKEEYMGLPCYQPEKFVSLHSRDITIVIAIHDHNEIRKCKKQLESLGFELNLNIFDLETFAPLFFFFKKQKLFAFRTSLHITDVCNLNCKHCASLIPRVKNPKHIDFSELKRNVDLFFNAFDYAHLFRIVGGEPFLYPAFSELISHIYENHIDKITYLDIITNGMIKLRDDDPFININHREKLTVLISDYSHNLPDNKKQQSDFVEKLENSKINYILMPRENTWLDFGYDNSDRTLTEHEFINIYDSCKNPCKCSLGDKYYSCICDAMAFKEGLIHENSGYDLKTFKKDDQAVLLEYQLGYSDKGYLELCKRCNGSSIINRNFVPRIEQIPRGRTV